MYGSKRQVKFSKKKRELSDNMFNRGDFHIHSTASDGDLSPTQVVYFAKSRSIDTIAITDHNTVDGINEAAKAASLYNVTVIPGVELSTRYKGASVHILGYFRSASYNSNIFRHVLEFLRNHRYKDARKLLSNIIYTEKQKGHLSILEGINLLRAFDASVVLAHPVRIQKKLLLELIKYPFDGIEAKYCWNGYEDTKYFVRLALSKFSFYTGGSDFHTNSDKKQSHCLIGQPYLDSLEIRAFIKNSKVLIL